MAQKKTRTIIKITVALMVLWSVLIPSSDLLSSPVSEPANVMVIAHGGGGGVWPINTMVAFEQAVDLGVDGLELDVRSTADDVLVILHDANVAKTTDGVGRVQEYTLAELQALDAGYRWTDDGGETYPYRGQGITIPTLREVFETFTDTFIRIDIKQSSPSLVEPICEMVREFERENRVLVASADPTNVAAFRVACPRVATSMTVPEMTLFAALNQWGEVSYTSRAQVFDVPGVWQDVTLLSSRLVERAQTQGMEVIVWTVDDVEDMEHFIQMGVDAIITDHPDRLLDLLARETDPGEARSSLEMTVH